MAIELGMRSLLLSRPEIVSLVPSQTVGNTEFQSIFCEHPAQGAEPPFILIHLIDFDPMAAFDGTSGMEHSEIDIDCYCLTLPDAVRLGKAVSDFLKDYVGNAGTDDVIRSVLWTNKRHDRLPLGDGRDMRHHIYSLSFEIQHVAI